MLFCESLYLLGIIQKLMVRKYGREPYRVVVVHGGPGALGDVAAIARNLSSSVGVLEPIQSKYTVDGLIKELKEQVETYTNEPLSFVGHSWGAWLVLLYAVRYPGKVKQLILVGCAPFEEEYVSLISERRKKKLSEEEGTYWDLLVGKLERGYNRDDVLRELERLVVKSDHYRFRETEEDKRDILPVDGKMYSSVWREAEKIRKDGRWKNLLSRVRCPVYVIHGEMDPHPLEGVIEPLFRANIKFRKIVLPRCGHSPFKEEEVCESFYDLLKSIVL